MARSKHRGDLVARQRKAFCAKLKRLAEQVETLEHRYGKGEYIIESVDNGGLYPSVRIAKVNRTVRKKSKAAA